MTARWAAALRMARRGAARNKARTLLIFAIILLPVSGAAFVDVLSRTSALPQETALALRYGQGDLLVSPSRDGEDAGARDPVRLLPKGSLVIDVPEETSMRFRAGSGTFDAQAVELDLAAPLAQGMVRLDEGRAAAGPAEIAVTDALADRLGVGLGGTVTAVDGSAFVVVGRITRPRCLSCAAAVLPRIPQGAIPDDDGMFAGAPALLVDLPDGTDVDRLAERMAAQGYYDTTFREQDFTEQNTWRDADFDPQAAGILVLIVGLGLLEVGLLAGTAIAVGVRRQTREVGLLAATGGSPADVRRAVLAQGLVLGLAAGVAGPALAVLSVVLGRGTFERLSNSLFGPLQVPVLDMAAFVLLGAGAGLVSALLPAMHAARLPVMAALSGRLGRPGRRSRLPYLGVPAIVLGLIGAAAVSERWAAARQRWLDSARIAAQSDLERPGDLSPWWPVLELAGLTLVAAGVVACTPAVVGSLGRLGGRMPLLPRLALRDASRHRHRVGPAAAAVMAAVTGAVALCWLVTADEAKNRNEYPQTLLPGQVYLGDQGSDETGRPTHPDWPALVDRIHVRLPGAPVVPVDVAVDDEGQDIATHVPADGGAVVESYGDLAVGDETTLATFLMRPAPESAAATLRQGGAVVFDDRIEKDDQVRPGGRKLPATVVDTGMPQSRLPQLLVSPETASRYGWQTRRDAMLFALPELPSPDALETMREDVRAVSTDVFLDVDRGWEPENAGVRLGIVGVAILVTIGGIAISVALSAAESAPDLATLASVGAAPRLRRMLSICQALIIGVVGTGLGVTLGSVIAVVVLSGMPAYPAEPPWDAIALICLGAPLLGALVAGIFTRSRLPLIRRTPA